MRVSIVTISFNQAKYLEEAISSVIDQDYPDIEYIVVDAGSTDDSREIIRSYSSKIDHIIFEPDKGPADGLNRGFSLATGEKFGFLNSDDLLLPGAVKKIVDGFNQDKSTDVISGHTLIVDSDGNTIRQCYSDEFTAKKSAYNAAFLMQPSTFFKASRFKKINGFNINNRSNWDGELWIDLYLNGARFSLLDDFLSCYRITRESITGSQKIDNLIKEFHEIKFKKIMNRDIQIIDIPIFWLLKLVRILSNPRTIQQRLSNGRVYGRSTK